MIDFLTRLSTLAPTVTLSQAWELYNLAQPAPDSNTPPWGSVAAKWDDYVRAQSAIMDFLNEGKKISAIKELRAKTHMGLIDAKVIIDYVANGYSGTRDAWTHLPSR